MRIAMAVLVTLLGVMTASAASPIGIGSIVLGMKRSDLVRNLVIGGTFTCQALTCRQALTVKGVPLDGEFLVEGNAASADEARLWEIRLGFNEVNYPILLAFLKEKHGQPSRSAKVTFRMKNGIRKTRETCLWQLTTGDVSITNLAAVGAESGRGEIVMTMTRPASPPGGK